jgi:cobalt-zinc-cadmium efflux system membrane fusion protein
MQLSRSTIFTLLFVVVSACARGNGETPQAEKKTAAPVDTTTLTSEAVDIAGFTLDTARSVAWQSSTIAPARLMLDPAAVQTIGSITEGRVANVLVRVGDIVREGDVLVVIHSHEIMDARSGLARAEAQRTSADAERTLARTAAERAQRLVDAKALSRAELERALSARVTADAMYEQAAAEFTRATELVSHLVGEGPMPKGVDSHDALIRAPASGVVVARDVQPGTVVLPGMQLITVADPSRLLLQLRLGEAASQGVRVGSEVRYTLTDDPTQQHRATVTRVAPTVDTLTRTIEILATPRAGSSIGRAESFAQAEVFGAGGTRAVVVPAAAVQALDGDTVVIAVAQRGAGLFLEAVPVRVGRRSAQQVEILAGLAAGRPIIANGAAIAKAELLKRRGVGGAE